MALLDLYATQGQQAVAAAGRRPVIGLDPGFGGAFAASWQALIARQSSINSANLATEIIDEYLAPMREAGEQVENPLPGFSVRRFFSDMIFGRPGEGAAALEETRTRYNQWAERTGADPFPTNQEIEAEVLRRRLESYQEAQGTLAAVRTTSSGIGSLLGGMAGALSDPITASSVAFGAGWASGIVRTALIEAGIGSASQFASVLANLGSIREVEPNFGMREILAESGMAAAGGALFGGGIKAIAAVWNLARNIRPWPSTVRDAGAAVERDAAAQAPQPVAPTVERATTQQRTVDQMVLDLAAERPITVPPAARAVADARIGRVFDASGRPIDVQYEVVPAASLVTSNLPDFRVNPAYPVALQPRDRTRAGSQAQVTDIAANLQPERLGRSADAASGAPIVSDGIVESGNGRVAAIAEAYRRGGEPAARYRAFLESEGFDLTGIADPVLIARRLTQFEDAERLAFVDAANRSQVLRLSAAEQALADARLIDRGLLDQLTEGDVAAAGNRGFVRGFIDRLPAGERGGLIDAEGNLSQAGLRRVQSALMGRAYGDSTFLGRALEHTDSNIRAVAGALQDAAGPWSQMTDAVARGTIPAGMNITRDLLDAVRTIIRARDAGRPVREIFNQAEMFGGPSEISKLLLRGMFNDEGMTRATARSRVAAMLRGYATEAQKNIDEGGRLFGEPLRSEEVLQTALAKAGRDDLAAEAAARTTPEAAAKLAEDPVTEDAIIRAGEELRMTPRVDTGRAGLSSPSAAAARSDATDLAEHRIVEDVPDAALNGALADARSGTIRLSESFRDRPPIEQEAIFVHEVGHALHNSQTFPRAFDRPIARPRKPESYVSFVSDEARTQALAKDAELQGQWDAYNALRAEMRKGSQAFRAGHWSDAKISPQMRKYLNQQEELVADAYALWRIDPAKARELMPNVSAQLETSMAAAREQLRTGTPRMIPESVEDEAGNVVFVNKSLDEVYDEADAEIAAAREIEACATGKADQPDN